MQTDKKDNTNPENISGNCFLYNLNIQEYITKIPYFKSILSFNEKEKVNQINNEKLQDFTIISFGIRRVVISNHLNILPEEIEFKKNIYGRPFINNCNEDKITFNLSHSKERIAIIVGKESPVGVDIQFIDPKVKVHKIASRFFKKEEAEYLQKLKSNNATEEFFYLWTIKEAFTKALGMGFHYPFSDVIMPTLPIKAFEISEEADKKWQRFTYINSNYVVSCVIEDTKG